jgi:ParB family chromosome partitioning protein
MTYNVHIADAGQQVQAIPISLIMAGNNDRKVFEAGALADLASSIGAHGLAQPITVRPVLGGRYSIVAGERRFRAIGILGWPTVPALVRSLTDEEAAAVGTIYTALVRANFMAVPARALLLKGETR